MEKQPQQNRTDLIANTNWHQYWPSNTHSVGRRCHSWVRLLTIHHNTRRMKFSHERSSLPNTAPLAWSSFFFSSRSSPFHWHHIKLLHQTGITGFFFLKSFYKDLKQCPSSKVRPLSGHLGNTLWQSYLSRLQKKKQQPRTGSTRWCVKILCK